MAGIYDQMMGIGQQPSPEAGDIRNTLIPPRVVVALNFTNLMNGTYSMDEQPTPKQLATLDACADVVRNYVVGEQDFVARTDDEPNQAET